VAWELSPCNRISIRDFELLVHSVPVTWDSAGCLEILTQVRCGLVLGLAQLKVLFIKRASQPGSVGTGNRSSLPNQVGCSLKKPGWTWILRSCFNFFYHIS
jgi:hypothetical protein